MAAEIRVRAATREDAEFLAPRLRRADREEVEAAGVTPLDALLGGLDRATWAYSIVVEGEVAAIIGVSPMGSLTSDTGIPWLLGSDALLRQWRRMCKVAPEWIGHMHEFYPVLVNMVHAKNVLAVKWLRHAGFIVHEPTIRMPSGELFCLFERSRDV